MDESTMILKGMEKSLDGIEKRLSALLALTALSGLGTSNEKAKAKLEVLLYKAGLNSTEIARVLGKKADAVKKTIQRAKK